VKLYRLGITGKCWRMLSNMYSTVHSRILTGQESDFSDEELEALYYERLRLGYERVQSCPLYCTCCSLMDS
jgi:hypothetical protein